MRVASDTVHRLLAYLAALGAHGAQPSVSELDAYAEEDEPRMAPSSYVDQQSAFYEPEEWTWHWAHYLRRRGWVSVGDHGGSRTGDAPVSITSLGRHLLRHLDDEAVVGDVRAVSILARGPAAYGRVIGRIAEHDRPLLVDAYFDETSLSDIVLHTTVSRLLLSDKGGKRGASRVAAVIGAAGRFSLDGRPLEIRCSGDLHDRFVVPAAGAVDAIGTSLNSADRHITTYVTIGGPEAGDLRLHVEGLWDAARPLFPSNAS